MGKFKNCLTETGDKLIAKRADNISEEVKDAMEEEKRVIERRIRELNNKITTMEDLSVRSTQTLIVGENLDVNKWVKERINISLELRDLNVELDTVNTLLNEYFE